MLKKILSTWSLVALFAVAGCATGSAGGPGAMDQGKQPIVGQADETFRLTKADTTVKQGETKIVTITIKRATNFDEDVTVKLADLPRGLVVNDQAPVIKHGDSEARFTLVAADDAALGDFSIKITGHPTKGVDAESKLDVTVVKK